MNIIDQLIASFSEKNDSDKLEIIELLEEHLPDSKAWDFLLEIACKIGEYDLTRIEVLKIIELSDGVSIDQREQCANALHSILKTSANNSDDICNYATMAATYFLEYGQLYQEILHIVLNRELRSELRWNAFAALKHHGVNDESVMALTELTHDEEFSKSATRVLLEWQQA